MTFVEDLNFLKKHKEEGVIELANEDGNRRIVVIPEFQGRIMTSSSQGLEGRSHGWINYNLISSGKLIPHMNAFGGEDRFWLGPEAGQYGLFFDPGVAFEVKNWQTPAPLDTEPFAVERIDRQSVFLKKKMTLTNYSGTKFNLQVERELRLLNSDAIVESLGISLPENISVVGFQSDNSIGNTGDHKWSKDSGLLSIWILGMFNPSTGTHAIIPSKNDRINAAYFGELDSDRIWKAGDVFIMKADGKYRSKIGLPADASSDLVGSFDRDNKVLTIVKFSFNGVGDYVNSLWKMQDDPYDGDVINVYNDGPGEDGKVFGPFFELETSSPAKELMPGEKLRHVHQTFHFEGELKDLSLISEKILGVDLKKIRK